MSLAGGGRSAEFVVEFFDEARAVDPDPGFAGSLDMMGAGFGGWRDADPAAIAAAELLLACALAACWAPPRRTARVVPLTALRHDG